MSELVVVALSAVVALGFLRRRTLPPPSAYEIRRGKLDRRGIYQLCELMVFVAGARGIVLRR